MAERSGRMGDRGGVEGDGRERIQVVQVGLEVYPQGGETGGPAQEGQGLGSVDVLQGGQAVSLGV